MLIQCPQCQTVYRLESKTLPENGLKMRCAKCRHVWRAFTPQEEDVTPAAECKQENTPAAENTAADSLPDTSAFRFAFRQEEKAEQTAAHAAETNSTQKTIERKEFPRLRQFGKMLIIALLLLLLAAAGWHYQNRLEQIAEKIKPIKEKTESALEPLLQTTAAFYQEIEQAFYDPEPTLKINGLVWNYGNQNEPPVIRLRGEIANPSEWLLNIPVLKIRLLDQEGNLLQETEMYPERSMIAPNSNIKLEVSIEQPPENVKQVSAYFAK